MTEVSFAKQFLTALDSRPIKLPSDHVTDPKTISPDSTFILPRMPRPMRKRARTSRGDGSDPSSSSSGKDSSSSSVTVVLKPLRGVGTGTSSSSSTSTSNTPTQVPSSSPSTVTLPDQAPDTSIYAIKVSYAQNIGLEDAAAANKAVEKMKIFYTKKLCTDSRTLVEIVGGEEKLQGEEGTQGEGREGEGGRRTVELSVMMLGGLSAAKTGSAVDSGEETAQRKTGMAVLQNEDFWVDLKKFLVQRLKDEGEGAQMTEKFRKAWEASEK